MYQYVQYAQAESQSVSQESGIVRVRLEDPRGGDHRSAKVRKKVRSDGDQVIEKPTPTLADLLNLVSADEDFLFNHWILIVLALWTMKKQMSLKLCVEPGVSA
ncbi:hypothetical protein C8J56DRAFT_901193 [Mycena floridula]|nr:hypothetical protein C8J56DRAFT_901193 [Mycena floridula]